MLAAPSLFINASIQRGTYSDAWNSFDGSTLAWRVPEALAEGTLGVVTGMAALDPRASWPGTSRSVPSPWWWIGAILWMIAWALGGYFFVIVPLWLVAPLLVALPPIFQVARDRARAIRVAGVAAVGLVPFATCVAQEWTDVANAFIPPVDRRVFLVEVAGHGPRWASGGGFGGETVSCAAWVVVLGLAWALALLGVAGPWFPSTTRQGILSREGR